jgi:hypothetical protein
VLVAVLIYGIIMYVLQRQAVYAPAWSTPGCGNYRPWWWDKVQPPWWWQLAQRLTKPKAVDLPLPVDVPIEIDQPKKKDEDGPCWEDYAACQLTKLDSARGRVHGETRCKQCLLACIASPDKTWRGRMGRTISGRKVRCDYWKYPPTV